MGQFGECQGGATTVPGEMYGVECDDCRAKRAAAEKAKLSAVKE
jgi:hypothetical protein